MKTVIAVGSCATAGFVGMFLYLGIPGTNSDPTPAAPVGKAAENPKPVEVSTPKPKLAEVSPPKPSPAPAKSPKRRTAKRLARKETEARPAKPVPIPVRKETEARPPKTTPKRFRAEDMYFMTVRDRKPGNSPSRVTIHNTPIGKCTILMIYGRGYDGRYFMSQGTTSGSNGTKKYKWKVEVTRGSVSVFWEGRRVRSGSDSG